MYLKCVCRENKEIEKASKIILTCSKEFVSVFNNFIFNQILGYYKFNTNLNNFVIISAQKTY